MKAAALLLALTLPAHTQDTAHPASKQAAANPTWYDHAVIYEIYPRSFQDTNGDGVGST